jgi:hypothetical protein
MELTPAVNFCIFDAVSPKMFAPRELIGQRLFEILASFFLTVPMTAHMPTTKFTITTQFFIRFYKIECMKCTNLGL